MNTKSIKSLATGDTFSLTPDGTVYTAQRVTAGTAMTRVDYTTDSGGYFSFSRASLTTAYLA